MKLGSRTWGFGAITFLLAIRLAIEVAPDIRRLAVEHPWTLAGYIAVLAAASLIGAITGVRNGLLVGVGGLLALASSDIAGRIVALFVAA